MQLTNDASDSEIDIELIPDTTDTLSDTTENQREAKIIDDALGSRPHSPTADDISHFIEQRLLSLDPQTTMALGTLEYHENFHPHYIPLEKEGNFGKTLYRKLPVSEELDVEADELGLVFFGEICSSLYGTAITAKGNHYAGSPENPMVSNDEFQRLL